MPVDLTHYRVQYKSTRQPASRPTPFTTSLAHLFLTTAKMSDLANVTNCVAATPTAPSQQIPQLVPVGSFWAAITDLAVAPMKACCSPNAVHQHAESCKLWCEVPDRYGNLSDPKSDWSSDLFDCLKEKSNGSVTMLESGQNKDTSSASTTKIAVWGLCVGLLLPSILGYFN
ncbi:hypothetical protein NLG97_g7022 [Lecanicillium saksenae]|uniref:Uncharacterized protein n=1 Tax=Lecanicillium saksenae TaxID=468837 RepID=A0ACC1QR69_9HYPO|nr:hypothetical protein NLG97_g7022 [Lecanicillium saksenae]